MSRFTKITLIVALIASIGYILLRENGFNSNSILNSPTTIDLSVNCSQIENLLVTSTTKVTVNNISSRTHENVSVLVTGYDSEGNITKQKKATFERVLYSNSSLAKTVTLPAKTKTCDCVIESSNSY